MGEGDKLRDLASWYREFAEQAENPMIWERRLLMAEDLDGEAERIERILGGPLQSATDHDLTRESSAAPAAAK